MISTVLFRSRSMQSEMMDAGRPSSLPTDDCAEGRPATALQRGTVALANEVVSSEDPFRNLSDDILEHILTRLSLIAFVAAKKVCKRWKSVTSTQEFDHLRKKLNRRPCQLVRYGVCCPSRSDLQGFAYDLETDAWVELPGLQLPADPDYYKFRGASGVVFAVVGNDNCSLLYRLTSLVSSFGETWSETPDMTCPFPCVPIELDVNVAVGAGMGHKLVVMVRWIPRYSMDSHLSVEVFDSESGTWESYGFLPGEFLENNWRAPFTGVVCDNKYYVSKVSQNKVEEPEHMNDSLRIHFLDLHTKQWASIQMERPQDLHYYEILAIGTTLVVAGFCADAIELQNEKLGVKLWKLDWKSLSLFEIGLLPSELCPFLITHRRWLWPLRFRTVENLVYVSLNDDFVVAEVSLEECKTEWHLLPKVVGAVPYITFLASISSAKRS